MGYLLPYLCMVTVPHIMVEVSLYWYVMQYLAPQNYNQIRPHGADLLGGEVKFGMTGTFFGWTQSMSVQKAGQVCSMSVHLLSTTSLNDSVNLNCEHIL